MHSVLSSPATERRAVARRAPALVASSVRAGLTLTGMHLRAAGATVLAYHDVEPTRSTFYSVTPDELRSQLDVVRSVSTVVPLTDLVARWCAGQPVDGLAAVTFDDALLGILEHAVPALAERGMPATIFAVSHALGEAPAWWEGSRRTMDVDELLACIDAGLAVESHAMTHRSLTEVGGDLDREVRESRERLQELTGRPVTLLAYPNGHYDPEVRAAAERAGYTAAFTFLNGPVVPGLDPYRLPRLTMGGWHHRAKLTFDLVRSPRSRRDYQPDAVHR